MEQSVALGDILEEPPNLLWRRGLEFAADRDQPWARSAGLSQIHPQRTA
jgi:hypothetical protein